LKVGLFDIQGNALVRRKSVELDIDGATTPVLQLAGEPIPDLVLPNDDDLTYTKIDLDDRSLATLKTHLSGIDDGLARAVLWEALWDMVRDAKLRVADYLEISLANIDVETDAAIAGSLISRMTGAVERSRRPQPARSAKSAGGQGREGALEPHGHGHRPSAAVDQRLHRHCPRAQRHRVGARPAGWDRRSSMGCRWISRCGGAWSTR